MSSTDSGFDPSADTSQTLYLQLRRIAQARFGNLPAADAVQATDVLHEVWAKLAARPWNDRQHFVATFARAAHQLLVDLARTSRNRRTREHEHARLRLDGDLSGATWHDPAGHPEEFLLLADAIDALRRESPVAADQLLTHLLLDISVSTIAESCEPPVSTRKVQRNLAAARLWVHHWMTNRIEGGGSGDNAPEPPASSASPDAPTAPDRDGCPPGGTTA